MRKISRNWRNYTKILKKLLWIFNEILKEIPDGILRKFKRKYVIILRKLREIFIFEWILWPHYQYFPKNQPIVLRALIFHQPRPSKNKCYQFISPANQFLCGIKFEKGGNFHLILHNLFNCLLFDFFFFEL